MATNRAQVSSSTTEPVWWCVMYLKRPLALWKPQRGHLLHQYEPSWNAEKAEVGGGALGPDTTGAATRDCTAATRARAKMSLFTTWTEGAGPKPALGPAAER